MHQFSKRNSQEGLTCELFIDLVTASGAEVAARVAHNSAKCAV